MGEEVKQYLKQLKKEKRMNLSKETKEKLILSLLELDTKPQGSTECFWEIGKDYVVRTVTMIYLGNLKALNHQELLLGNVAWIPDTSRWSEFLKGARPNEMEPYVNDVIVGRGSLLDATEMSQKIARCVI